MKAKACRLLPSSLEDCTPHELHTKRIRSVSTRGTKQVNESSHDSQTNEWCARTQQMRAGGVYLTPFLCISNKLSSNHSPMHRQAEWMWALSLQKNGVTCHFHPLAYSYERSSHAFKQRWHLLDANHNSYCANWKIPSPLCIDRKKWHDLLLHSYWVQSFYNTLNIWKVSTWVWRHMETLLLACPPTRTFYPLPFSMRKDHSWGVHMLIHSFPDMQPR